MRVPLVLLGALLLVSSACTGTGVNRGTVYQVESGTISLGFSADQIPAEITEVEFFFLDEGGQPVSIGRDSEGPEFSVQFDTTKVNDGINLVRAVGNPGNVTLLENSIFIANQSGGVSAFRLPQGALRK